MTNRHFVIQAAEGNAVVYALHRPNEDYRYIGVSLDPKSRFRSHRFDARHGRRLPVYTWMRKYTDIVMTIIDVCETYEQALSMEMYWIAAAGLDTLLNITEGVEGVRTPSKMKGIPRSEETKRKIGATNSLRTPSAEELERLRTMNIGRKRTAEQIEKRAPKLTWDKVRQIRAAYPNKSSSELCKEFGVSQTTISNVVTGFSWKEVSF